MGSSVGGCRSATQSNLRELTVSLVDVDDTLLDNGSVKQDLKDHLERAYGHDARDGYWTIPGDLFSELGYRDYLGAGG